MFLLLESLVVEGVPPSVLLLDEALIVGPQPSGLVAAGALAQPTAQG